MKSSNTKRVSSVTDKFTLPEAPRFSPSGPWWSVISLLLFAIVSVVAFRQTSEFPGWARAPFLFTAIGGTVGFLYELWLIATVRPSQLYYSANGILIQSLRAANLPFVFGSVYVAFGVLTLATPAYVMSWICLAGFLAGLLWVILLFQRPPRLALFVFLVGFVGQVALVYRSETLRDDSVTRSLLVGAATALLGTIIAGSATPERSTIFHFLGIVVIGLMVWSYQRIDVADGAFPDFDFQATWFSALPFVRRWMSLIIVTLAAIYTGFRLIPKTWNVARSYLADATWPLWYLIIAGGLQVPRPERLSLLYRDKEDQLKPLKLLPYRVAHQRNLSYPIYVPCLDEALTLKIRAYDYLMRLVEYLFAVASYANRLFPFANIHVPLRDEPRMEPWSDGSQYWPRWLMRRIYVPSFGWFQIESGVRGPGIQPAPDRAVQSYLNGQLLAYLAEYGIAGPFLASVAPATAGGAPRFSLDFRFLEHYETKPD